MNRRLLTTVAGSALALTALAGCSAGSTSGGGTGGGHATGGSAAGGSAADGSSADALATGSTSLGTVVVDGHGRTVYFYDQDTANSGTSTCTGSCATLWPAVETTSTHPVVHDVTGTVGTITGVDGRPQLTIDGRPVYTYAGDAAKGDVTGQGVGGIWHVVEPDGTELTKAPAASSSSTGGGYTY
ncbi:hypothetical protein [Modestobacter sp. NPDC049651]|uniref:COG4315 family predicted lipoprotein n=1 Tax=unclassified Modestobacter TaxID=2643866 RepID=UPI00340988A7